MRTRLSARAWILSGVAVVGLAVLTHAQPRVTDAMLARKKAFAEQQLAALAQPFVGLRTSSGVTSGLFPIRASGVSTAPIVQAAEAFLATLTAAQTVRTVFAADADEWRRWSNVDNGIYTRQGVSLREMSLPQREAAMALLRTSLSAKGLALSQNIMKTDQTLSGDQRRHAELRRAALLLHRDGPAVGDRAVGLADRRPSPCHQLLRPRPTRW